MVERTEAVVVVVEAVEHNPLVAPRWYNHDGVMTSWHKDNINLAYAFVGQQSRQCSTKQNGNMFKWRMVLRTHYNLSSLKLSLSISEHLGVASHWQR